MDSKPVFYDPKGKRSTFVTRFGAFVGSIVAVLSTLCLVVAFFTIPYLPRISSATKQTALPGMPRGDMKPPNILTASYRRQLALDILRDSKRPHLVKGSKIVAGFYAPWEATGLTSFRAHAPQMTHVLPEWLHINPDGKSVDFKTDFDVSTNTGNRDLIQIARKNGVAIVPILDNSANGVFDHKRVATLLRSIADQKLVAVQLAIFLNNFGFQGLNLDFELLTKEDAQAFIGFLKILRPEFARYNLSLSVDLETESALPVADVAALCDWVVLMAYDEHSEDGQAGPIAGIDWAETELEKTLRTVPNDKVVLGIGNYAYDWTEGQTGAESQTFQEALTNAAGYRSESPEKVIQFDENSFNNTFAYRDDNDKRHVVWMLDGISAFNQWKAGRENQIRGAAMWVLGSEDPTIWTFLDRNSLGNPMSPSKLERVKFPYEVSFAGRGEILSVKNLESPGTRKIVTDPEEGLISGCTYTKYAFPLVIQKRGFLAKKLALTFDDGPDPTWTPQILQVLKEFKAPATFFVIGNSCEQHPGIVAQEYQDGHEIGSHSFFHPNMGAISEGRDRLELNLTQLAIESATGRSTILFRPPYNADSEPETLEQVRPIEIATQMGYVTVAENVDPLDWDLKELVKAGVYRPKTAEDIASAVEEDIRTRAGRDDEGNVILLHDAGGNRSQTVAALRILIPRLRQEGYELVTVSALMGTTRDRVMPPIPPGDMAMYLVGKIVLGTTYAILWFLSIAFVVAIGLGLTRIFVVTTLALWYRRGENLVVPPDFQPSVSVLIAAYNEEPVIVRTIESVLRTTYPIVEVIVVDDGSKDGTSAAVRAAFSGDERVRLVEQENGGKSTALNNGMTLASGEILFCIDADTQLDPPAIELVVRHFVDAKVGAVAGNVRVGNEVNVITYWQSLEYTTSQNLDRRAYALLNAITVVPGAIGAWRKDAVLEVGGYLNDTLAEDMDLTWRLRRAGYRLANESNAYAYTEAPQTFRAFFGQRFRWAYGTLQCLFKHRRALFRYQWFGWLSLPALWVFQVFFQAIAPLVDVEVILSIGQYLMARLGPSTENGSQAMAGANQTILQVGFLYAVFFVVELVSGFIATKLEKQRPVLLWWLFLQRFAYRQIMYGVIYRSLVQAIRGGRAGWGKLDRKGTVKVPKV